MELNRISNMSMGKVSGSFKVKGSKNDSAKIDTKDSFHHVSSAGTDNTDLAKAAKTLLARPARETEQGIQKLWRADELTDLRITSGGRLIANKADKKTLTALSQQTGKPLWSLKADGEVKIPPTEGPDGSIYTATTKGHLYAVNPDTGKVEWEFQGNEAYSYPPAFDGNGNLYFNSGDSVFILDGKNHKLKNEVKLETGSDQAMTVGKDGTIYLAGEGKAVETELQAYDPDSGKKKWSFKCGGFAQNAPVLSPDGKVYVKTSFGTLYSVDGKTGKETWNRTPDNKGFFPPDPMAGPDGTVYAGTDEGIFFAMDGNTGEAKWQFKAPYDFNAAPVLDKNGTLFVGNNDGALYAYDTETGKEKWKFQGEGVFNTMPVLGPKNRIYVRNDRKDFYVVNRETGKKEWQGKSDDYIHDLPIVDNKGNVYFACSNNKVFAYTNAAERAEEEDNSLPNEKPDEQNLEIKQEKTFVEIGGVKLQKRASAD